MVFIKSQEYVDPYGKKSKNIICLEGQTDYKMALNQETNKFDVTIVMGDYEKFIFTANSEGEVDKIMQNVFTHHSNKEPYVIYDINAFMIPEVESDTSLEEIEDLVVNLLDFHGYKKLVEMWENKLNEEMGKVEEGYTSPLLINEDGEVVVDKVENVTDDDQSNGPFHPITSYDPNQVAQTLISRGVHYQ